MDNKAHYDAHAVCKLLWANAKMWWWGSLVLQGLIFVAGVATTLTGIGAKTAALFVIGLTVTSHACKMRSAIWQGRADTLQRKLDLESAYGWLVEKADWSDILITMSPNDLMELQSARQDPYFASNQSSGVNRALENLQESSWFSKHLAAYAGHISLVIIVALIGGSITTMVLALNNLKDFDLLANLARVVTSTLMLVFSMDLLTLMLKYYGFGNKAGLIERQASEQLKLKQHDIVPSLKLWQDYHVNRAMSPLIPTWLWLWKRKHLNQIWEKYRK